MRRTLDRIEEDPDPIGLLLSMRTKMIVGGLCFFLFLALLAYPGVPHVAEAIRGLAHGATLVENESQPPEQEESQEPPQAQETMPQGIASASRPGIFIKADGSVSPPTAPILRDGNVYTLYDNIYYDAIRVERDNTVIDGAGLWVMGFNEDPEVGLIHSAPSYREGVYLGGTRNVTISNLTITGFKYGGISASGTDSCTIVNCTIQRMEAQYLLSDHPTGSGIYSEDARNLIIKGLVITGFKEGISLWGTETCLLVHNTVSNNGEGIIVGVIPGDDDWGGNFVVGNMVTNNSIGVSIDSQNGTIYHNNFINNVQHAVQLPGPGPVLWDSGHLSGGNYWDDYTGHDSDNDGIGDTPYIIGLHDDQDRYPLMKPWTAVPEPALLPYLSIVGLFLLPTLLRRSGEFPDVFVGIGGFIWVWT